jgi:hypothetical protein
MPDDHDLEKALPSGVTESLASTKLAEAQPVDVEENVDRVSSHSLRHSSDDSIQAAPLEDAEHAERSRSKASSARSRPLSIVPRAQRRGLLGRFTIIPEVERPYDYKNSVKWSITFCVALAAAAAPVGSAIFYRRLTYFVVSLASWWSLADV